MHANYLNGITNHCSSEFGKFQRYLKRQSKYQNVSSSLKVVHTSHLRCILRETSEMYIWANRHFTFMFLMYVCVSFWITQVFVGIHSECGSLTLKNSHALFCTCMCMFAFIYECVTRFMCMWMYISACAWLIMCIYSVYICVKGEIVWVIVTTLDVGTQCVYVYSRDSLVTYVSMFTHEKRLSARHRR